MTLVLEIEYLTGVSFAAVGPDSDVPDWPPQPDRVFSALVATWAAHGQPANETEALEWLEKLPPPRLLAAEAEPRTPAVVFVPPNDPRCDRLKNARGVLPALRSRQSRRFPATRPHVPVVLLIWEDADPPEPALTALERLAHDTSYIGHSTSFTRCRFMFERGRTIGHEAKMPVRRVYHGRLTELCRDFDAGRRPLQGALVVSRPEPMSIPTNVFGDRWLLLEHVAGRIPDIRACAVVARVIRDSLLSGYRRSGLGDRIPEEVSGHSPDGTPTQLPHIAIAPLAFVGFPHADGHVLGFALIPPRGSSILDDDDFRNALRMLAAFDQASGRRVLTITTKEGTSSESAFSIDVAPTFEASRRSLDPALYVGRAQSFATVTPIALDRHLKESGEARQREITAQIAAACRNVGLPDPEVIVADKHSAFVGAPSARASGNSPAWTRWSLPRAFASRQLTHAAIRFSAPVEGPVILGAARYLGLGVCRPLDEETS